MRDQDLKQVAVSIVERIANACSQGQAAAEDLAELHISVQAGVAVVTDATAAAFALIKKLRRLYGEEMAQWMWDRLFACMTTSRLADNGRTLERPAAAEVARLLAVDPSQITRYNNGTQQVKLPTYLGGVALVGGEFNDAGVGSLLSAQFAATGKVVAWLARHLGLDSDPPDLSADEVLCGLLSQKIVGVDQILQDAAAFSPDRELTVAQQDVERLVSRYGTLFYYFEKLSYGLIVEEPPDS